MRWKRARRSDNVLDARGSGRRMGIGGKGLSLGGIAVVVFLCSMAVPLLKLLCQFLQRWTRPGQRQCFGPV